MISGLNIFAFAFENISHMTENTKQEFGVWRNGETHFLCLSEGIFLPNKNEPTVLSTLGLHLFKPIVSNWVLSLLWPPWAYHWMVGPRIPTVDSLRLFTSIYISSHEIRNISWIDVNSVAIEIFSISITMVTSKNCNLIYEDGVK